MTAIDNRAITVLVAMRQLLGDERRWNRGSLAVDASEHETSALSDDASKWCLAGAAERCAGSPSLYREVRGVILAEIRRGHPRLGIHEFNDHATHAEVLRILDAAIATLANGRAQPV